jgi:hypothetical protein
VIYLVAAAYLHYVLATTKWECVQATLIKFSIPAEWGDHVSWRDLSVAANRITLEYHFEYMGRQFSGRAITVGDAILTPKHYRRLARKLYAIWQADKRIEISVNPNRPGQTFLTDNIAVWPYCFGVVGIAMGFFYFI